ncbi:E3 ubiquitin-protein ligase MGRN1 isoform X1 [Diorhabda sublineata]|uniref:E3 ubiquitin-protein ligase MGRN1 isoform X1 n=1 Tax=Diorhabda sublineata TaxID=1163346 RepID=UPI0024E13BBD|nr:E3 ubiquitin-protein ligase MGRN1 isoform X1 [Diorhabda sublineata]
MGALLTTRQHDGVEEIDIASNHAYKYPPRSGMLSSMKLFQQFNYKYFPGNYFGSHFIMGGERFDTPQPESYLFGENSDLNFLGSRPTPFPYPPPQPNEPTKTLKCLVNIRKESLRFVRTSSDYNKVSLDKGEYRDVELGTNTSFNIEFTFDCDVRCAITIYYFCTEDFSPNGVTYIPKDPSITSETFHYSRGSNQQFCQPSHVFNPAGYSEDELLYDVDREIIPLAIHCVTEEGPEEMRQSHTTIATVEKITDGTYLLKALKQKLFVDGLCYLLQEIYGIENKNNEKAGGDDDTEDNGSECVICMCDVRDTLILPCRHLCLCNSCADSLRYQANNCPICRAPFRALLQIRALQKCSSSNLAAISPPDGSCDNIPPGYEAVSLIEALNGPCAPRQPPAVVMPDLVETPENEHAIQAAQILNRQCERGTPTKKRGGSLDSPPSPDYSRDVNMVPTRRLEEDRNKDGKLPLLEREVDRRRKRDDVRVVNEKNDKDANLDEDSETEKLSPLLQKIDRCNKNGNSPLNMKDVVDPIDDNYIDQEEHHNNTEKIKNYGERGDESDYYTPDEPAPSSVPIYEGNNNSSLESTPQRLPGTPMSHASMRSSGDSYTSGSSTRHLLAIASTALIQDKAVNV